MRSSKPVPRFTAVRAEGGGLLIDESEVKARCAGYFEQLYQADIPAVGLDVKGVAIPVADPPINCDPTSFVETQAAVNLLKWGKAPGICSIHADFSRLVEMLHSCHYMQFYALPGTQVTSQLTGRGGLVVPLWKG